MRTHQEIVEYYAANRNDDILGFTAEVLMSFLSFEQAKPLLKADATDQGWGNPEPLTEDSVLAKMDKYMEFAWGKVEDHRGISAGRSVEKMGVWLWLLEDDELVTFARDGQNYAQYGAPILKKICAKYGFLMPDNEQIRNMAQGRPCHPGCNSGCDTMTREITDD